MKNDYLKLGLVFGAIILTMMFFFSLITKDFSYMNVGIILAISIMIISSINYYITKKINDANVSGEEQ